MEDTLRGTLQFLRTLPQSLNPCFNGRYSQSILLRYNYKANRCLNPCFNGRYSQSATSVQTDGDVGVLILVLMEDTLRVLQRHGSLQHWVS